MRYLTRIARKISRSQAPLAHLLRGDCRAVDETVAEGFTDSAERISYSAVLHTLSGESHYSIDSMPLTLIPGSLLILPSGRSFSEHTDQPCHNRYLMLQGPVADSLDGIVPRGRPFVFWEQCPPEIAATLGECVALAHQTPDPHAWRLASALCRLVDLLQQHAITGGAEGSLATRVRALVIDAPARDWRVEQLSRRLGVSPSSLAHRFRMETGSTPAAFVRKVRCEVARNLLEAGWNVSQTAERLGFQNPYHFSRVFKSVEHVPPSEIGPGKRHFRRGFASSGA